MNRVLVNTSNTVFVTFYVGEDPADADAAVSVTVVDAGGNSVASGNANDEPGAGNYSFEIPPVALPTELTVTWSGDFSTVENSIEQVYLVVGRFLFPLSDLRATDGLEDTDQFTTEMLVDTRDMVTDLFNAFTWTAFGETYHEQVLDGVTTSDYFLLNRRPARRILSINRSGTPIDSSLWVVDSTGYLTTPQGVYITTGRQNYVVAYTYGYQYVPGDVKRAALKLARAWLLGGDSAIPDRARQMTTEWGTFMLTAATDDYPTGMPEVDAVLRRYRRRLPGFA